MLLNRPTLYLIRGVCGSGKSTFARQLYSGGLVADVFEADQWFEHNNNNTFDPTKLHQAHKACQQWAKMLLQSGESVAVSNTSTTEKEVQTYFEIATELNANFVSVVVESRHNGKNIHNVSDEKIKQMRERFSIKL